MRPADSAPKATARWEHYEHGADIGVRGYGASLERAFEQAALALVAVIANPDSVDSRERVTLSCEAPDDELLFAEWLNAIVYEMDSRKMLFGRFRVKIDRHRVVAEAWGEPTDVARHRPAVEVKGATYTTLRVAQEHDGTWVAQTVVDV